MATPHKLNGIALVMDEPYPFLEQAHAFALMARMAMMDEDSGTPNNEVMASTFNGIATLIELASIGLETMVDGMKVKGAARG